MGGGGRGGGVGVQGLSLRFAFDEERGDERACGGERGADEHDEAEGGDEGMRDRAGDGGCGGGVELRRGFEGGELESV